MANPAGAGDAAWIEGALNWIQHSGWPAVRDGIESAIEAIATTHLALEPLTTINAIGIAIMLFSLEQHFESLKWRAEGQHEWKRLINMSAVLRGLVIAGFFHMASIMCVLISRVGCDDGCPPDDSVPLLVWATRLTIFGMAIVIIGVARAYASFITIGQASRQDGNLPSLTKPKS